MLLTRLDAGGEAIDAFSRDGPAGAGVTLVVLNGATGSASRSRFDMGDEPGHPVMHRGLTPDRDAHATQANRFASVFLLPAPGFARDFRAAPLSSAHQFDLKGHRSTRAPNPD